MRAQPNLPVCLKRRTDLSLLKKYPNPALNKDTYYEIKITDEGKPAVTKSDFSRKFKASFFSDNRIKYCWTSTKGEPVYNLPSSTAASTSFNAGSCNSCGSRFNHSINNQPMLFIIGDENCPPSIGTNGECCAVLRVDDGNFSQAKAVLLHHLKMGLRINEKSVIIVLLVSHLMRYGLYTYINDLSEFTSWAYKLLKVEVIPGIPPYPAKQDTVHLASISQFSTFLQASHIGCGSATSDSFYSLWSPFMDTAKNLKAFHGEVPAAPIHVWKANSYVKCNPVFPNGFEGDWSNGIPTEVQIEYFSSLIDHLRLHDLCNNLYLPSKEAIKDGINLNLHCGKKVFVLGSSIAGCVASTLKTLGAQKGVMSYSETRSGDVLAQFNDLDFSCLQAASKQDKLFVYWLGNVMYRMKSCRRDEFPVYHPNCARVLDDVDMDRVVALSGKKLRSLAKDFPGHIYFMGPFPRHLLRCCEDENHIIRGPSDETVNIINYTTAFSTFMERSPGIVQDRISFIHYQAIFGNDFTSKMLTDGVHLNNEANLMFANFILDQVDVDPIVTIPELIDSEFSDFLKVNKVIDTNLVFEEPKNDEDTDTEDMNIDTAIYLNGLKN